MILFVYKSINEYLIGDKLYLLFLFFYFFDLLKFVNIVMVVMMLIKLKLDEGDLIEVFVGKMVIGCGVFFNVCCGNFLILMYVWLLFLY